MAVTPMMAQYLSVKEQYRDSILFFRLGDFYEMFYDDAKTVSRELDLVLTGKDCGEPERAPMCGIPYHSSESYIGRLVNKGYKVVICEQTEDPAQAKGLVKREVVRIVTPGTLIETELLDERKNNYFCTVAFGVGEVGVCFADISTGEASGTFIKGDDIMPQIINEIAAHMPREVLLSCQVSEVPELCDFLKHRMSSMIDDRHISYFDAETAEEDVERQFGRNPADMDINSSALLRAVAAMLLYMKETHKGGTSPLREFNVYIEDQYMQIDANTRRNLELCETMRSRERKGTLLWVLDRTKTSMGARLLRKWIDLPLRNAAAIGRRQTAVKYFVENFMNREDIVDILVGVYDIERLIYKVIYETANARDLLTIGKTLALIPNIKSILAESTEEEIKNICSTLSPLSALAAKIDMAIDPEASLLLREGGIIRKGYNRDVDDLRDVISNSKDYKSRIEAEEREKTGIKTLKIGYNRVFGYYIEVSKSYIGQVPENYIRKQTLTNGERYITDELKQMEATLLGASDKLSALEYELFCDLRREVAANADAITANAAALAKLDVYAALADVAVRENYVQPEIEYSELIEIHNGRHPVVEKFVEGGSFVPNDALLDTERNRLAIITGPNMAGKSTYMRQIALIVLMAQIGSFVPAASARIGVVDKLFTRVGASDDLASGQSTFMLEMSEVAYILQNATRRSLIIYDEIGRGTSTFDGMSIARAVAEYTISKKIGAKTLFATHYHELTSMADEFDCVVNYSIAAKKRGDDLIFLRKILKSAADDSYGIEVAKLAGVPNDVIKRAREVLKKLEADSKAAVMIGASSAENGYVDMIENVGFDDLSETELRDKLSHVDVDALTPREALELVYELKKIAEL